MRLELRCSCGAFLKHDGEKYIDNIPVAIEPCKRCTQKSYTAGAIMMMDELVAAEIEQRIREEVKE